MIISLNPKNQNLVGKTKIVNDKFQTKINKQINVEILGWFKPKSYKQS